MSLLDAGNFAAGVVMISGISVAVIEGVFRRPKERADTSIELVKIWMVSNKQLVDENARLTRENERYRKAGKRLIEENDRLRAQRNSLKDPNP